MVDLGDFSGVPDILLDTYGQSIDRNGTGCRVRGGAVCGKAAVLLESTSSAFSVSGFWVVWENLDRDWTTADYTIDSYRPDKLQCQHSAQFRKPSSCYACMVCSDYFLFIN